MSLRVIIFAACLALVQCKLINLSCQQIRQFVDGHNSRRLQIAKGQVRGQPAASEMKFMIWDDELAQKAARWATKNTFEHNPDKYIASKRFKTGENLYWYGTTNKNYKLPVDAALEAWFIEHKDYSYRPLTSNDFNGNGPDIGHYTQMVWADTTHVGCAISQYPGDGYNNFLVVCNYGPGGNFIDDTPYKKGRASGKLKCGTSSCEKPYASCT